jgi:hypothetical protein
MRPLVAAFIMDLLFGKLHETIAHALEKRIRTIEGFATPTGVVKRQT